MKQDNKQLVTIKGTRDGFAILIHDDAAFRDCLDELEEKLSAIKPNGNEPEVSVIVQIGNRYLDIEQRNNLKVLIEEKRHFKVEKIESDIIRRDEVLRFMEESEIKLQNGIVRSGQILKVTGDLLFVGDVNPGGKIMSTGNIYVMGKLMGIAHAGINGDRDAFIAASYMKPTQLRIADYISRAPDYESVGVYLECGLIDLEEDKIVIDSLQLLSKKQNQISGIERRMNNG